MFRVTFTFIAFIMVCVTVVVPSAVGQDISVSVSLDRDSIGLDEQAMLQVEVSGTEKNLPDPRMPTLAKFEVYSQGRSSSLSIVNGQVSSSVTYRYVLLPTKPGIFPIDNIAVVHKNRRYKGNRLELTVLDQGVATSPALEAQAQDGEGVSRDYFLEAVVDNRNPYVNEQVTLTLKFHIAVQYYGSPELAEPTTTGFWAENLGNKAPYYQTINGRNYRIIERKYALFPTQTGELTIGRAMISATVASKKRNFRDPFDVFGDVFGRGENVSIRSNPIKVKVRPLPTEGRPSDFTGTIGNFSITAVANKTTVEVNQPVSLTIRISGTGNVKSVAEPIIPDLPDFRIRRASSSENVSKLNDKIGGTKIYEEVFIPNRPGQLEIPTLSFNYFDPKSGKYESISTRPIKLNVTKPEGYIASSEVPYAAPDFTISSEARDIRYIKDNVGNLRPIDQLILRNPVYVLVNGLPIVLLAGMVLMRVRRERLEGDVGYARSRAASKVARKRLAKARAIAGTNKAGEFFTEVYLALISYIADKMNISPHGLTTEKIAQLLNEKSVDSAVTDQIGELMQKCDFARYAPSSMTQDDISASLAKAEEIMVILEGVRFDR